MKEWTQEERNAAAKQVLAWPCPLPSSFSDHAVDLQCEINEARELLEEKHHLTAWHLKRDDWLSRNAAPQH